MTFAMPAITVGWVIALVILILTVVFIAVGQVPLLVGGLIAGVALARLL
ncbi:MAG TPA: hypothetical protein VGJ60_16540 [Chloroflexota bacterium]|jgi:hypothetical protein